MGNCYFVDRKVNKHADKYKNTSPDNDKIDGRDKYDRDKISSRIDKFNKTDDIILENLTLENTRPETYNFKKAKILKVYDGDTYWIGTYNHNRFVKYPVRLYGIDCPELKDPNTRIQGYAAKDFVSDLILNKIVDIEILTGQPQTAKSDIKEKYGRLLCNIMYNGHDLAQLLLINKHAKIYGNLTILECVKQINVESINS